MIKLFVEHEEVIVNYDKTYSEIHRAYTSYDIINPAHIVNVMYNDIEQWHAVVEFVNRTSHIEFITEAGRLQFANALQGNESTTIEIKSLRNEASRWHHHA